MKPKYREKYSESETEGLRPELLGYTQLLLQHLNRISQFGTQDIPSSPQTNWENHSLFYGVQILEAFLSPYLDDEYKKDREELSKRGINDWHFQMYQKLAILTKLMHRLGLLLETTETVDV